MISVCYLLEDPGIRADGSKGAAIHVRQWLRALAANGADIDAFLPVSPRYRRDLFDVKHSQLRIHPLDVQTGPSGWDRSFGHRAASAAALSGRVYERAKQLTVDALPDLIYTRYSLYGTAAAALAREWDRPLYLEVNAPLRAEEATYRTLELEALTEAVEGHVFRSATRVIAVSNTLAAWLEERGVPREKILVITNGVDTEMFRPGLERDQTRRRLGFEPDDVVIGFAGSLKPWHAVSDLLIGFAAVRSRVPRAKLLIVGEGPERKELTLKAETLGLGSDCVWLSSVPHSDLPLLLCAGDIWTAPYPPINRFYFSPLKLFEYAASGCAMVASRVGQIDEILVDGHNGLLVPPGDAGAFGEALLRLAQDPGLRHSLGERARDEVALPNSWREKAREVLQLAGADARTPSVSIPHKRIGFDVLGGCRGFSWPAV